MSGFDEKPLLFLLKASDKNFVKDLFDACFRFRHEGLSQQRTQDIAKSLEIKEDEVEQLFKSVSHVIRTAVYDSSAGSINLPLSADFHPQLKTLIAKVINANMADWREAVLNNQVSPPKLLDFDWRVDTKASSSSLSRMSVPALLLELKIQQTPVKEGLMPGVKTVQLELSKQELATMLDGLTKIRDQLSAIK